MEVENRTSCFFFFLPLVPGVDFCASPSAKKEKKIIVVHEFVFQSIFANYGAYKFYTLFTSFL